MENAEVLHPSSQRQHMKISAKKQLHNKDSTDNELSKWYWHTNTTVAPLIQDAVYKKDLTVFSCET